MHKLSVLIASAWALCLPAILFAPAAMAQPLVLGWEDLVPEPFTGKRIVMPQQDERLGKPKAKDFQVTEEELKEFLGEVEFMRDMQPRGAQLVGSLDGKVVRIPGYVTPVGFDGDDITQFLLVPFLGACIHVPPPAANQIIYVKNAKGLKLEQVWEPIWLTGTLTTNSVSTILADVGYTMNVGSVEPYEELGDNVKEIH